MRGCLWQLCSRQLKVALIADLFGARNSFHEPGLTNMLAANWWRSQNSIPTGFGHLLADRCRASSKNKNRWLFFRLCRVCLRWGSPGHSRCCVPQHPQHPRPDGIPPRCCVPRSSPYFRQPTCSSSPWKRGSSRSGSSFGSTCSQTICSSRASRAFSSHANAASSSPSPI